MQPAPFSTGGYREALSLTNPDGTRLFPDRDDNKWNTALNACKDFIDYAETGNRYELYKEYTTSSTGEQILDVDASVYNLFQKYNKRNHLGHRQQRLGRT